MLSLTMGTAFQPHVYAARHDTVVFLAADVLIFLCVHWFSNFGVWSHDWKDPINSLWLYSQTMGIMYEMSTRHAYKQIVGDQINIPENLYFFMWLIYGFRFYTGLIITFMSMSRLSADLYSLPAAQQMWFSTFLVMFVLVRILDEWGLFDWCRSSKLRPVSAEVDPRTLQKNVKMSHDGTVIAVDDKAGGMTHVARVHNTGEVTYEHVHHNDALRHAAEKSVHPTRCKGCQDPHGGHIKHHKHPKCKMHHAAALAAGAGKGRRK